MLFLPFRKQIAIPHMKKLSFACLLSLCFTASALLTLQAQKPITLEDIWTNGTFNTKGVPGFRFQNDGVHYTRLTDGNIEQYDLRTGEKHRRRRAVA